MSKKKKITLIVTSICLLMLVVVGVVTGILLAKKYNTKVYGIKHKVLQSDIVSATFDQSTNYLTMQFDFKISLLNKTKKEYIYNADVLYLKVDGGDADGVNGHYYTTFNNGEKEFCFADSLGENSIFTIPTNNGISSLNGTINLKLYFPYAEWNDELIRIMNELEFELIYNGVKVGEFEPDVKVTHVEGSL